MPRAALLLVAGWQEAMWTPRRLQAASSRDDSTFQTGKRLLRNQGCIHNLLLAYIGHEQMLGFGHQNTQQETKQSQPALAEASATRVVRSGSPEILI